MTQPDNEKVFDVHPDEWQQILPPTSLDFISKPPDISNRSWAELIAWVELDEPNITKEVYLGHGSSGAPVIRREVIITKDTQKEDTDDSKSEA